MQMLGSRMIGEPISLSDRITVQLAVPPRISGPYDGIQVT
jgi:hypothetical protein